MRIEASEQHRTIERYPYECDKAYSCPPQGGTNKQKRGGRELHTRDAGRCHGCRLLATIFLFSSLRERKKRS